MKTLSKRSNPSDSPRPAEKFLNALNALLKGIKRGLKAWAERPPIRAAQTAARPSAHCTAPRIVIAVGDR